MPAKISLSGQQRKKMQPLQRRSNATQRQIDAIASTFALGAAAARLEPLIELACIDALQVVVFKQDLQVRGRVLNIRRILQELPETRSEQLR